MNRKVSFLAGFLTLLYAANGLNAQEVITPLSGNPQAEAFYKSTSRLLKSSARIPWNFHFSKISPILSYNRIPDYGSMLMHLSITITALIRLPMA